MLPTRTQITANTNSSNSKPTTPIPAKDPTPTHPTLTSPMLDEARTVDGVEEEVPFAEDTTTDADEEEDGSD